MATPLLDHIDDLLHALPERFVVAAQGQARLVAGPNGAFVVTATGPDLGEAVEHAHAVTERTRRTLFDHLTWVPFLDAIVVTMHRKPRSSRVTVVPLDMLGDLLTEGRHMVDPTTLHAIRTALWDGRLDAWRIAVPAAGGRIDLCDPTPAAPAPTPF